MGNSQVSSLNAGKESQKSKVTIQQQQHQHQQRAAIPRLYAHEQRAPWRGKSPWPTAESRHLHSVPPSKRRRRSRYERDWPHMHASKGKSEWAEWRRMDARLGTDVTSACVHERPNGSPESELPLATTPFNFSLSLSIFIFFIFSGVLFYYY